MKHARTIDVHAHIVLAQTLGMAGEYGPTMGEHASGQPFFQVGPDYRLDGVRYAGSAFMDVDARLARMQACGIDFQVVSPNPLTYFHFIPVPDAVRFCATHNDTVAALCARHSDRLAAFAALPMQDPMAAVEELERAVVELGLLGGYFGTDLPMPLHDAAYDLLYEKAVALDVPLFIHPGPAGIDGPPGDANLKHFELEILSGFCAQETLAVAGLIFGGVLDRHPDLDICISHGGGAGAFMAGRLAQAARKRPWVPAELRADGEFEKRMRRLWVDTHVGHPQGLQMVSEAFGQDHLVYGTNFAGWDAPDGAEPVSAEPQWADNARRLLRADTVGAA